MTKLWIYILLCASLACVMWGCLERVRKPGDRPDPDADVVARVGDAVLREADVRGVNHNAASVEDSLKLLEGYVNSWVRRQVKIQEAEKTLKSSGVDIEGMVNDYRNALLINRLDQYYIEMYADTVIPLATMEAYHKQHASEFRLDRNIVEGRIVRVPVSYRQQAKLKELMASPKEERRKDFIDLCVKNNFQLWEFDRWVDFREFLSYLPTVRGKNYEYLLTRATVQELADADYKYYIMITDKHLQGSPAPFEWVENIVRRIIQTQRSSELVRQREDSLYNAAMNGGLIVIKSKNTNVD